MLKLYGHPVSTCTQRVLVTLKEKGIPYELIPVNVTKREEKERLVGDKNPFAQIPVIVYFLGVDQWHCHGASCQEEDGHQLYESRAIARYIALKYTSQGTPLYPDTSDLKAVAKFESAACVEIFGYYAFASGAAVELGLKKVAGAPFDEAQGLAALEQLRSKLKAYDTILSKRRFLAGDSLTVVDLFHLPEGELITNVIKSDVLTSDETPNVARWWREISNLPSWRGIAADAAEALKTFPA